MSRRNKKQTKDYGLKVQGTSRIFSKTRTVEVQNKPVEFTDCWVNISLKTGENTYDNKSMKLIFPKEDQERPENNTVIDFLDAWFMLFGDGKYQQIAIFVKEWDYVD